MQRRVSVPGVMAVVVETHRAERWPAHRGLEGAHADNEILTCVDSCVVAVHHTWCTDRVRQCHVWCYERTEKTQTTTERERERGETSGHTARVAAQHHQDIQPVRSQRQGRRRKTPLGRYHSTGPLLAHSSGDLFGRHAKHDRRRKRERRCARKRRKAGHTCKRRSAPTPRGGGRWESCKSNRSHLTKAMLALDIAVA